MPTILANALYFDNHNIQMNLKVVIAILLLGTLVLGQLPNCKTSSVSATLRCSECNPGFQLDDQGQCKFYTPIEGCLVYNSASSSSGCVTCDSQYLLQNGYCLTLLPNCLRTTNIQTCDQCKPNFVLVRSSACLSTDIGNCPLGFIPRTVNGVSYCQQYSQTNCMLSYPGQGCQICLPNYRTLNGICLMIGSNLTCPNNNCQCQGYYYQNTCYAITVPNCLQSTDRIYCDLCADGYKIDRGICVKFVKDDDINCNVLTTDNTRCDGCNFNYVLDPNYICVRNFSVPANNCLGNFWLYNGVCFSRDPLCIVYNFTQMICGLCQEGYSVNAVTRMCQKTVTCLRKDTGGICQVCFSGYQLDPRNNECLKLPPNCVEMDVSRGVCLKCSALTSFSAFGCIFPTTNCKEYNSFGRCQICQTGFVEVNRFCRPIATNCLTFGLNQAICSTCNSGYHIYQGQCYRNVEGCLTYSQKSICSRCDAQYLPINGSCFLSDAKCLAQDISGACLGCRDNFIAAQGKCVFYDPFCLQYDLNNLQCITAASGFSLGGFSFNQQLAYINFVAGAQAASGAGAASSASSSASASGLSSASGSGSSSTSSSSSSFSSSSSSTSFSTTTTTSTTTTSSSSSVSSSGLRQTGSGSTATGSYTSNGHILSLPYSGLISSTIASYSFNGLIRSCNPGYTLIQGQCVTPIPNCQNYSQYSTCILCNPGYDLMANNSCILRSSASCQLQAGGICSQAAQGFVIIEGSAVYAGNHIAQVSAQNKLVAAESGYFVWQAMALAWPLDRNCKNQYQPNLCINCNFGYTLLNGQCVIWRTNCLTYSTLGLCVGCQSGFMLWAGECKPSNCVTTDPTTGFCLNCQNGFQNRLGVCVPTPQPSCQVYSSSQCAYCSLGNYLTSSGLCSAMIPFCKTADPQTGRCLNCMDNYTYYSQQCIPLILNCEVYQPTLTSCATCSQLYYPISQATKCGYMGTNCLRLLSENNCGECKTGFMLITQNVNKLCVRNITNCLFYDLDGNCVTCTPGYVLQFNTCKSLRCLDYVPPCCRSCAQPWVLQGNTCNCIDPNCLDPVGQTCNTCKARHCFKNGQCKLTTDANCMIVDSKTCGCVQCYQKFIIGSKGTCEPDENYYNGCLTRNFPCPACEVGFQLRSDGFCWARKCFQHFPNRNCLPGRCYNYYIFDPFNRFCILHNCQSPACYTDDTAPPGFYYNSTWLNITHCLFYNGQSCLECQDYYYPGNVTYNLCFPHNCRIPLLECNGNCLERYVNVPQNAGSCVADKCQIWFRNGRCQKCVANYDLHSFDGSCLPFTIPNCKTIDYNFRTCRECNLYFQLYNGGCRPANCSKFGPNNSTCQICQFGYFYNSQQLCYPGKCALEGWPFCQRCINGYWIYQGPNFSYIGLCQALHCRVFNYSTLVCDVCENGFEAVPTLGICRPTNCQKVDETSLKCLNCSLGYILAQNGSCVGFPNCLTFNTNPGASCGCASCIRGFVLVESLCLCLRQIPKCQNYSQTGCQNCLPPYIPSSNQCAAKHCELFSPNLHFCSKCQTRFREVGDGTCYPRNCQIFNQISWKCEQCQPRFQLISSVPLCLTRNCLTQDNYLCRRCEVGFLLEDQTCLFSNCLSPQQLTCPQCLQGFTMRNGLCYGPRQFCRDYDEQLLRCRVCISGYKITPSGLCIYDWVDPYCRQIDPQSGLCSLCFPGFSFNVNSRQCQSDYCRQFNIPTFVRDRYCSACIQSFVLDPTARFCIPVYCRLYSLQTGQCTGCYPGSYLNNNNICFPLNCLSYSNLHPVSPYCQTCTATYYSRNPTSYICEPTNCRTFNSQRACEVCLEGYFVKNGYCMSCQPGFTARDGNCVPGNCKVALVDRCDVCEAGYMLEGRFCIPQNCIKYNRLYICTDCGEGYRLVTGSGRPPYCQIITPPTCQPGFYLSNQNCIKIPIDNCAIYNPLTQTCWTCFQRFYLWDNVCWDINYCLLFSYITGCQTCIPRYYLQGNLCHFLNCKTYTPDEKQCKDCYDNYTLVPTSDGRKRCAKDIYQCVRYDDRRQCLQCNSGYSLNDQNRCVANYCRFFDQQSFLCSQCIQGYTLNRVNDVCNPQLPNCFLPRNTTFCQQCVSGYVSLQGVCFVIVPFCREYQNTGNGWCRVCSQGYYVNNFGQCLILPLNCIRANSSGWCQECYQGYVLTQGQCAVQEPNCIEFDNSGRCTNCTQGYYLTSNRKCWVLPPFCTSADLSGRCLTCFSGYSLSYGQCVVTVPFCRQYNRDVPSQCFDCFSSHYLTNFYRCANKPPNCNVVDPNGVCIINCIDTRFSLINGLCVVPVMNCLSYRIVQSINDTRCARCVDGYQLDQVNNLCRTNLPPYCLEGTPNNCQRCAGGYTPYQGLCVRDISFCQVWNLTSLQCSGCIVGYSLTLNRTVYSFFCNVLPQYCLSADLQGFCTSCLQGYSIYSGRCIDNSIFLNCQIIDPVTLTCVRCLDRFNLVNNRCLPRWCRTYSGNLCVQCEQGYKLVEGGCEVAIANCLRYTTGGWCAECMNGYSLSSDGRSCITTDVNCLMKEQGVCVQCRSGYDLLNNWCTLLPLGCSRFLSPSKCLCLPNFHQLSDLVCVRQVPNCNTYNPSGCQTCLPSFYLWSNLCRLIPLNCAQYDPSTGRCLRCNSGFVLNQNDGLCNRGADICLSYDSQNRCIYCAARYYLENGGCKPYPDYCVCVDLLGRCLSCAFGSQLRNGACVPTSARNFNCLRFDNANLICLECSPGYSLCQATGLCLLPDPGCTRYSGTACVECKDPYILRNGQCVLYPPGVLLMQNGAIVCRDGYTQFNNSCLKTESTLTKMSNLPGQTQFSFSSGSTTTSTFIGSNAFWTPSFLRINEYLSMTFTASSRARVIFQIGIRGSQQGWVSGYVLYYRNKQDGPFVCWNGCNMVAGNSDGSSTSWLKLYHPIVATELRFYPVRWVGVLTLQTDVSLMPIQ